MYDHDAMMRLATFRHSDPHSVLGMHPCEGGVLVRAYRPDAQSMRLIPASGKPLAMLAEKPQGCFAAFIPGAKAQAELGAYKLEVTTAAGHHFDYRDPYAFMPALGELDVYLAREGRHEALYNAMGARVLEQGGVAGVAFTVWAPAAAGVSVVGDFNQWDGRHLGDLHPPSGHRPELQI
jgi:1,4-alpha-glucan branching enzyme